MNLSTNLDWLYTLAGWTIAGAGLLLLLWALFRDRSRGRRRCPRCWYDMAGVPGLICPECGKIASKERQLFRTHRRRGCALIGLAGFVIGACGVLGPAVWRNRWDSLPTWALCEAVRWSDSDSLWYALEQRLADPTFPMFSTGPVRDSPPRWRQDALSDAEWNKLTTHLLGQFGSSNPELSARAVIAVAWNLPTPLSTVPVLENKLAEGSLLERVDVANAVVLIAHRYNARGDWTAGGRRCRAECDRLIPHLVALLNLRQDSSELARFPTIAALGRWGVSGVSPEAGRPADVLSVVRGSAADAMTALGILDHRNRPSLEAAAKGDTWVAYFAKQALTPQ